MSDTPRAKLSAKHPRTLDKTRAPVRSSGALRRPTKAVPASMLDAGGTKKAAAKPARPRRNPNPVATLERCRLSIVFWTIHHMPSARATTRTS